jgi:hypothetical protein
MRTVAALAALAVIMVLATPTALATHAPPRPEPSDAATCLGDLYAGSFLEPRDAAAILDALDDIMSSKAPDGRWKMIVTVDTEKSRWRRVTNATAAGSTFYWSTLDLLNRDSGWRKWKQGATPADKNQLVAQTVTDLVVAAIVRGLPFVDMSRDRVCAHDLMDHVYRATLLHLACYSRPAPCPADADIVRIALELVRDVLVAPGTQITLHNPDRSGSTDLTFSPTRCPPS